MCDRSTAATLIVAVLLLIRVGGSAAQVDVRDELDAKASRVFSLFVEGCILGDPAPEARIRTLDLHPLLKRAPNPPGSPAAASGRKVWQAPPDFFLILESDGTCRAVISDDAVRNRIAKFIEGARLKLATGGELAVFEPIIDLSKEMVEDFRAKNVLLQQYKLFPLSGQVGLVLTLETSIHARIGTFPVRLSVHFVERAK